MTVDDQLRRVTVVCPTYQRSWTSDWQKAVWAPYPVDLIIADGSAGITAGTSSGQTGNCRWTQLNMPGTSYFERVSTAASAVETRHAIIIDDEEAYFYRGLEAASRELDANSQAACAGGTAAHMRTVGGQIRMRPFSGRIADWSVTFSLEEAHPAARIEKAFSTYRTGNLFYSLVRTNFMQDFFGRGHLQAIETTLIGYEFLWTGAIAASGTYSMGNYPFWLRMGGSQSETSELREILTESDIEDIAARISEILSIERSEEAERSDLTAALTRGIRIWENRVFGSERPSRDQAKSLSLEADYLQTFESTQNYLNRFPMLSTDWEEDLGHIVATMMSPVRPVGSLSDAMA